MVSLRRYRHLFSLISSSFTSCSFYLPHWLFFLCQASVWILMTTWRCFLCLGSSEACREAPPVSIPWGMCALQPLEGLVWASLVHFSSGLGIQQLPGSSGGQGQNLLFSQPCFQLWFCSDYSHIHMRWRALAEKMWYFRRSNKGLLVDLSETQWFGKWTIGWQESTDRYLKGELT